MSISKRIVYIQQQEGFTASKFAEKLGVQRSGISHIYSGRNNPSIDFIQKLLDSFPQYRAEWILTGKEPIKNTSEANKLKKTESPVPKEEQTDLFSTVKSEDQAFYTTKKAETGGNSTINKSSRNADIELEKIILVYENGTFETLYPKK